jgi:hypothetical protein
VGEVVANMLPLILSAAALPLWIIMTLLLLRSESGVMKAAAFAIGAMAVRVLQGFLFGYIFGAADKEDPGNSDLIVSTLLLVVGIVLLATAVRIWFRDDDPDAPPPKWMMRLSGCSALTALGIGASMMAISIKQWIFTLSAIAAIYESPLSHVGSVLVYLIFVVAAHGMVLAPIIASAVRPTQSVRVLDSLQGWLNRNSRVITMVASVIFGGWFTGKGASGLLSLPAESAVMNARAAETGGIECGANPCQCSCMLHPVCG